MNVPDWIFVILTSFSVILVALAGIVTVNLLKYWYRKRKYEYLRRHNDVYIPQKCSAFLHGYVSSAYNETSKTQASFMPTTSLKAIQSKRIVSDMFLSQQRLEEGRLYRAKSFDDRYFRRLTSKRSGKVKLESPIAVCSSRDSDLSSTNSILGCNTDASPNENHADTIYMHSEFLNIDDPMNFVTEPVISYDQDSSAVKTSSLGVLSFLLEYKPKLPELLITVKSAIDLKSSGCNDALNSYVNLCIVPEDFLWKRTQVVLNDCNPIYNETFQISDVLYHKLREYTLCFYVMECHPTSSENVIGKILYPLSDLRAEQIIDVRKELCAP